LREGNATDTIAGPIVTQVPTRGVSTVSIMRREGFRRGLESIRAGELFDTEQHDHYWSYERGRMFGAIAPRNMSLYAGSKLNPKAVQLCHAAFGRKFII
jgi:hypothetical protein